MLKRSDLEAVSSKGLRPWASVVPVCTRPLALRTRKGWLAMGLPELAQRSTKNWSWPASWLRAVLGKMGMATSIVAPPTMLLLPALTVILPGHCTVSCPRPSGCPGHWARWWRPGC